MNIHFIAIGGAAMHNLALAIRQKGDNVTGSDDEIFDPAKSRLDQAGLLPAQMGWFPEKINKDLDAVIVGMHAREDNPELLRAKDLGIRIYSYPEFLYQQAQNKIRVVIGGSHGKTTVTSMILHVLNVLKKQVDYMVGAQIEGFDTMVRFSEEARIAVFEGDEYLTSPIDPGRNFTCIVRTSPWSPASPGITSTYFRRSSSMFCNSRFLQNKSNATANLSILQTIRT